MAREALKLSNERIKYSRRNAGQMVRLYLEGARRGGRGRE